MSRDNGAKPFVSKMTELKGPLDNRIYALN